MKRYSSQGKQAFDKQELIQVWMVHHFQIIGEAANSLSLIITDSKIGEFKIGTRSQ